MRLTCIKKVAYIFEMLATFLTFLGIFSLGSPNNKA